jgi:hypothetical protein
MRSFLTSIPGWTWRKLQVQLVHPCLPRRLALVAVVLSSTALGLGFYLDDHVARYVYSDRQGAERLFKNHSGGFGFALGDPVENHWLMEMGWAPWFLDEHTRFAGFRPIAVLTHMLDFRVLLDSALLMHAHSLLWLAVMVIAVARMYRELFAPAVAGAAALLFALDYTHAFEVGYILNRHALLATTWGALTLAAHFRSRNAQQRRYAWLAPALYLLGLFTSELSISVAGYVIAFELLARQDARRTRALAVLPFVAITLAWGAWYSAAGFGASGTGFYIDPVREPPRYLSAFTQRGPLLLMGQFAGPPAELYYELPRDLALGVLSWAVIVVAIVAWALLPLLRSDRTARFWCLGMLGCLLPAAGADANNRQLLFVSLGAMGLLAQAWQLYAARPQEASSTPLSWMAGCAGLLLAFRLFVSPVLLPIMTVSVGLMSPVNTAAAAFAKEPYAGRDLIFVTAPYVYAVRVVQLFMRLSDEPLPRRVRYISAGAKPTTVRRAGANSLEVEFKDGLFSNPELRPERDRRLRMPPGSRVQLDGFYVEILADRPDAGPTRARFTFDKRLEDPSLAFYRWGERTFVPFAPPPLGEEVVLPGSRMPVGFE